MQKFIIVRGPSGSGKSTFVDKMFPHFEHFEADMYFMEDGVYRWEGARIKHAHQWCKDQVRLALSKGLDVVVSNTSTTIKEVQVYLEIANEFGIKPDIYRLTNEFQNTHGVPADRVQAMRDRMEDVEGEIFIKAGK